MVTRLELHEVTKALGDLSLSIAQTRELTFNLGVELRELDNVDEERRGNDRTKYYMQIWLNNNPDASWRSIIEALKSMRLNRQATQLTEMLSAGPEVTHPVSSHPSRLVHAASDSTGENVCPSAQQLSERLSELKQSSQYTESREEAEHSSEIEQLQLQLRSLTDTKAREAVRHREQISGLEQERDRQLQEKHRALVVAIASRDQAQRELHASEQLVSEFQNSMQLKDKTIADLQRTISDHERKIQQPKQGDRATGPGETNSQPQHHRQLWQ